MGLASGAHFFLEPDCTLWWESFKRSVVETVHIWNGGIRMVGCVGACITYGWLIGNESISNNMTLMSFPHAAAIAVLVKGERGSKQSGWEFRGQTSRIQAIIR
ncbi:hypothetical protein LINGRAHAP2_LOCUS32846 [Linum grandiflorum]